METKPNGDVVITLFPGEALIMADQFRAGAYNDNDLLYPIGKFVDDTRLNSIADLSREELAAALTDVLMANGDPPKPYELRYADRLVDIRAALRKHRLIR